MTPYLSDKLRVLSAISIILVIYIHMYYAEGSAMINLNLIEGIIGNGFCLLAVPLFYVISGYLFFLETTNGIYSIAPKLRKRIHTLLVPYVLMNTLALLFYLCINLIANKVPAIDGVLNFHIIEAFKDNGIWKTLISYYWTDPVAFQLWFIRDLMVVMLCSPLIYLLLKFTVSYSYGWIIILLIEGLLMTFAFASTYFISAFWFIMGGTLVMHPHINLTKEIKNWAASLSCAIIMFLLIGINLYHKSILLEQSIALTGIIFLWITYDVLTKGKIIGKDGFWKYFCSCTFFVYLVHEPLLNILKKIPLLISRAEIVLIASYIIIPVMFYWLATYLGLFVKKIIPGFYKVFTGDR